ncbi:hypothetical protein [[Pseudomonas] boreopolis]|jgi:hypothetical protein|uniref:Sel1 repeat family protein n=1 Tax=Xanthomonas boreopolis TaxID=86183 RepID=A0A919F7L0_9XANT|nr:hypothetical protein GCM10009090_18400 [[Pseudomonas] boreopolis]
MPIIRARNLWLLLAPAVLAAAWWQHGASRPGDLAAAVGGQVATSGHARFPAPAREPVRPEPRRETSVPTGLPLDQRAGLEQDADLYGYAQQLAARIADGDADAGWMLSRVYDYCAGYALDPAGYLSDSEWIAHQGSAGMNAMVGARARLAARCAGFTPQDGLSAQQVLAQRVQAARSGSLAAEAALLSAGQPLDSSVAYKRNLVERVLASRDPEAYLALSLAMGARASGDDAYEGFVAGDQYAELAWQVAACRLGLECGADGTLMTSYCAIAGICSQDSRQDFESFVYDAAVPRQGASRMDEMITSLVKGEGVRS